MEINLNLPQGSFSLKKSNNNYDFIMAAAGGRKPALNWFKAAAADKKIYCADKGIEICFDAGFIPELLCGDADSAGADYLKTAKEKEIKTLLFNPAKDDTDLQLLLKNLPLKNNLLITGIWGGRFDHLFSNVFSLLAYKERKKAAVVLADDEELIVMLTAGEELEFIPAEDFTALSLLPLRDSVVSLKGTRWELEKSQLLTLNPYAVSNEIIAGTVNVICHSGCIGFYLKIAV